MAEGSDSLRVCLKHPNAIAFVKLTQQMCMQSLAQMLFCYRFKSAVVFFLKTERKADLSDFSNFLVFDEICRMI